MATAVMAGGLSRRAADDRFSVAVSLAIKWVDRWQETDGATPGKVAGHKPKRIVGTYAEWLRQRCRERAFTLRGLVKELASARGLKVEIRSV